MGIGNPAKLMQLMGEERSSRAGWSREITVSAGSEMNLDAALEKQ